MQGISYTDDIRVERSNLHHQKICNGRKPLAPLGMKEQWEEMVLWDPRNHIFPTESSTAWKAAQKNLEPQRGHCLAEDVVANRDGCSWQRKRWEMPQLLPSILRSTANASDWSNPAKRQLARSLENTACRSKQSPTPSDKKRRGRTKDGLEGK